MTMPSTPYETLFINHTLFNQEHPTCAIIHLHRPAVKNALNPLLMEELIHAFSECDQNSTIHLIILTGDSFFCAGADLNWMKEAASYTDTQNKKDATLLSQLFHTIEGCSKPTLALVQGGAFGGGVGLVAACDVAMAEESALFCLSEVRLGLVPGVISPYLIKAIGLRQAQRLTLTAERFSGKEACQLGLVHTVTTADQWEKDAQHLIQNLLKGSPQAHKAAKKLFKDLSQETSLDRCQEIAVRAIADARASQDGKEGIAAFFEKRPPSWNC